MRFLDFDILVIQLIFPNWRFVNGKLHGKIRFLNALLTPFKELKNDLNNFKRTTRNLVNLNAQVIVIENYLKGITGLGNSVFITDGSAVNHFVVHVPLTNQNQDLEIQSFLKKYVPIGRKYTMNYY